MRNLLLPPGMLSVSVFDQSFGKDGVIRGVEDHIAREILAHDPRITEFVDGDANDPDAGVASKKVQFLSRVSLMDRTDLFSAAKALKISAPANWKTAQLREVVAKHAADANEEDLPLVLGGIPVDDGAPSTLQPGELASPNRGNDSLGHGHLKPGSNAGGATFSQESLSGAAAPANPAPAGLGVVQPTGTQQPPFNQLATETGVPAHDSTLAAYPIAVPPIDPHTGKPYAADDPRIPASALPLQRTTASPAEQVIDGAEVVDGVHPDQVEAVHRAASDLDRAVTDVAGETSLISPQADAERKAHSDDAEQRLDDDPNHGNDAEGQKPDDAPLKN